MDSGAIQNSEFHMEKKTAAERDFLLFERDDNALIDEVVSMRRRIGLTMESEDVHELLKSHKIELITEELQHLQEQQDTG